MYSFRFLHIFLFMVLTDFTAAAQNAIVKTTKGYIRGAEENGILVFKAVPYAAPPVGSLRFMPPVQHAIWHDTLSTIKFGNWAAQPSGNKTVGNEDCLLLNLYTPKADNAKRPVVVWVHGGSMTNGTGAGMDGHAFSDNDGIVTVTINYRLGALGFMYMGDLDKRYAQSGNCGLLDVIMALKWIKWNIAAFGGDPGKVTVMGESAGAKLLSAVLVSPESKGLFRQCILESGSVQCIRDTVTSRDERTRLLKQLGLQSDALAKLLALPADSIMRAQGIITEGIGGNSQFGPVYDGITIPQDAYQLAAGNNVEDIKVLIGTNENEAAAFIPADADLHNPDKTIFKPLFGDNATFANSLYQTKLKTDAPYPAIISTLTQYMYQMHSYRLAKVLSANNVSVWMYRYQYQHGKLLGARHGDELHYIWSAARILSSPASDSTQKQLAKNLHGAWVAFIKTGNPNISTLPAWPTYNSANPQVMSFDTTDKLLKLNEVYDDINFPSAVFVME